LLNNDFKILKSGTDIRGVATDDIKTEALNLTDEKLEQIATGFLLFLAKKFGKEVSQLKLAIGRDCRISGEHILNTVLNTFLKYGATVINCGLASTPSMFMAGIDLDCDGTIEITASHHPFNRNGLKFFTQDSGLDHTDITEILELAQSGKTPASALGSVVQQNYMQTYAQHLQNIIKQGVNAKNYDQPLLGYKIVVDAGNGVGGFYANDVLKPLGADIAGSRFLEPDGMFPNHIPNPELQVAMDSITEAVLQNNADLGVIFDTDVDRGAAVDSSGKEINRNRLIALVSLIALEKTSGGTIVTDSITSSGVHEFIEKNLGGKHCRYMRGYRNVINKSIELNEQGIPSLCAIETSGHVAFKDNYFLDDGAYLVTQIIIKFAKCRQQGIAFEDLLKDLKEPAEEKELRFNIAESDFIACGKRILAELEQYAKQTEGWSLADDNVDAIRINFGQNDGDGWVLLRLSVHDPVMPLNIESNRKGGVQILEDKIMAFLKQTKGLQY
jgi:phosphomannomutase